MPVVSFEGVDFSYGRSPVVKGATFSIEAGEFIGLIGPNGGGKTTLLRLLMGLLEPTRGEILLFGTTPQEGIRRVGYVPQNLPFDRQFPISTLELVLGGRLSRTPWYGRYGRGNREAALGALDLVELRGKASSSVASLSGGELQRALIARALASEPELLLLDEATAHVDHPTQTLIYNLLSHLAGKTTIVMVTHDLEAAIHRVDRILCAQREVSALSKEQVCEHFALGLYHPPLLPEEPS
ncbi:MAG: metal ABC transporter ATP-binding protein [Parachlamydiales bacterium]